MAKPDLSHILARAKARLGNKPAPVDPAIAHTVLPVATAIPPRPLAEFLADAIPPETDWERAYRQSQEMAPAQAKGRGPNLHVPYSFKGGAPTVHKLSEVDPNGPIPDSFRSAQKRIALGHAITKTKIPGKKLNKAERKLIGEWNLKRIVAGLYPRRKPKGE